MALVPFKTGRGPDTFAVSIFKPLKYHNPEPIKSQPLDSLLSQGNAHAPGHLQHAVAVGDQAALAGNVGKLVFSHVVVLHSHGDTEVAVLHHLGGVGTELGSQHPVVGGGTAAPLGVPGDTGAGLKAGHLLDLAGDAVGGGGDALLLALGQTLLLLHAGLLDVIDALGHRQDGEVLALLGPVLNGSAHLFNGVGTLGNEDDICAAGDACVQGEPARLVAHQFHQHAAAVAAGGGVDPVDGLGGNVNGRVETEGHVGAVDVIVDGLGQAWGLYKNRPCC